MKSDTDPARPSAAVRLLPAGAAALGLTLAGVAASPFAGPQALILAAGLGAALAVSAALAGRELRGIRVALRFPDRVFVGDSWTLAVEIEAPQRGLGCGPFLLFLREAAGGRPDGAVAGIRWGRRTGVRIPRRARRRGIQALPPLWLVSSHPFGLLEARRRVRASRWILAVPRPARLASDPVAAALREEGRRGRLAPALDPAVVRPWRPGDDARRIHWRTTARRNRLHVVEPAAPPGPALALVVDDESPPPRVELGDEALRLAASIAARPGAGGRIRYSRLSRLRERSSRGRRPWLDDPDGILADLALLRWRGRTAPPGDRAPAFADEPGLLVCADPSAAIAVPPQVRVIRAGTPAFRQLLPDREARHPAPRPARARTRLGAPGWARILAIAAGFAAVALGWGPIRMAAATAAAAGLVGACFLAARRRLLPALALAAAAAATLPLWRDIPAAGIAAAAIASFIATFRPPEGAGFVPVFAAGLLLVLGLLLGPEFRGGAAAAVAGAYVLANWIPVGVRGRSPAPLAPDRTSCDARDFARGLRRPLLGSTGASARAVFATACLACGLVLAASAALAVRPAPARPGSGSGTGRARAGATVRGPVALSRELLHGPAATGPLASRPLYRVRVEPKAPATRPASLPLYLKVDHLPRYDGGRFARSEAEAPAPPAPRPAWRAEVEVLYPVGRRLPHAVPLGAIEGDVAIDTEPSGSFAASRALRPGDRYRFTFGGPRPRAPRPPPTEGPAGELAERLRGLAGRAGATGLPPAAAAARIAAHLRSLFTYDELPAPAAGRDPISAFLESRRGPCGLFAATAALALRSIGIPARVARGFLVLRPDREGVFVVRPRDAHAWIEVLADGVWGAVEVTPGPGTGGGAEAPAAPARTGTWEGWLRGWPVPAIAAAGGLAACLLWLGLRLAGGRGREPGPRRGPSRPLEGLLRALAACGHPRAPWCPVLAHVRSLPADLRARAPDLEALVAAYYAARFGGGPQPPELAARLDGAAHGLRGARARTGPIPRPARRRRRPP